MTEPREPDEPRAGEPTPIGGAHKPPEPEPAPETASVPGPADEPTPGPAPWPATLPTPGPADEPTPATAAAAAPPPASEPRPADEPTSDSAPGSATPPAPEPTPPTPEPKPATPPEPEPASAAEPAPEPAAPSTPEPAPSASSPSAPPAEPAAAGPASSPSAPPAEAAAAGPPPKRRRRPRRRTVVLGVLVVIVVALVGGLAWFFSPQPLLPEATAALASTPAATFSDEPTGLTYTPVGISATTGLILYPGAKVPAEAYAPGARAIAEEGFLVVVVPMPLNFAIFDVGAAADVIAAHPDITRWAIGGHSLGGAMAAQYAADHPGTLSGLVLCGAYSASNLSASGLVVSSVYGSLDAAAAKIEDPANQALLPATTAYDRIQGGNHEQCGWYTGQPNDPPATIPRAEQQARMIADWVAVLRQIASAP